MLLYWNIVLQNWCCCLSMTERRVTELEQFRSIKKNTSKFSERIVALFHFTLRWSYDQSMNNNDKRIFFRFSLIRWCWCGRRLRCCCLYGWLWLLIYFLCAALRLDVCFFIHNVLIALRCFAVDSRYVLVYVCMSVCSSAAYFRLFVRSTRLTIYVWVCLRFIKLETHELVDLCGRAAFMRVCFAAEPLFFLHSISMKWPSYRFQYLSAIAAGVACLPSMKIIRRK